MQNQNSWTSIIRNIADHLRTEQNRLRLLAFIDKFVIEPDLDLDRFFNEVSHELLGNTHASAFSLYINVGPNGEDRFLLYVASQDSFPQVLEGEPAKWLRQTEQKDPELFEALTLPEPFGSFPSRRDLGSGYALRTVLPVPLSNGSDRFGTLILYDELEPAHSRLNDSDVLLHCRMVKDQLNIAVAGKMQLHTQQLLDRTIQVVFERGLKPSVAFEHIRQAVSDFLPQYGPLKLATPPKVQILSHEITEVGKPYLTIKATDGREPFNTVVQLDESICGWLIQRLTENPEDTLYLLVDPHKYLDKYQWFLDQDADDPPSSELAVAVMWEHSPIGIFNLEHQQEGVFLRQHVEAMVQATRTLAPFFQALNERLRRERDKSEALEFAIGNHLARVGAQFRHRLSPLLSAAQMDLFTISQNMHELPEPMRPTLERLPDHLIRAMQAINDFTGYLPSFHIKGNYKLKPMIQEVLNRYRIERLKERENIEVTLDCPIEDLSAYCTPFLKEHLFNFLDNALYSVREAQAKGLRANGSITVRVFAEEVSPRLPGSQDRLVQTTKFCIIAIRDNGMGMPEESFAKLGEFGFSTKPSGTGFGIAAAREYAQLLGGDLTYSTQYERFFEVTLRLNARPPHLRATN